MDELVANLGKKLRHYRTKKDITLKELAGQIGVTPSLLSQIENGKAAPSLGTLKAIADVCKEAGKPCQISLEERMACGMGACLVCAVKVRKNGEEIMQHVCKNGPVFNAEEVVFNG